MARRDEVSRWPGRRARALWAGGILLAGAAALSWAAALNACDGAEKQRPGIEGARAVLKPFLAWRYDPVALTRRFKPTPADYRAIFTEAVAPTAEEKYERAWKNGKILIKRLEHHDDLLVYEASVEDLKTMGRDARKFPAAYALALQGLRPGNTFYYFKFVKKGNKDGLHYDGLVFVNGHWVVVPKPWRVMNLEPGVHPF